MRTGPIRFVIENRSLQQGYQYLFAVQFFNSNVYRGRLVCQDKGLDNRDRHHRIRRQILRVNEGLILILAQS